jgi:hypothetical protein
MKRFAFIFSLITAAIFIAALAFTACEGPAGPAGLDGADGLDGIDANETCKVCHNDETKLLAKQVQAGNSVHMTGGHFERSEGDCAACHTHEGFIERMTAGTISATDVEDPTPPNCRTCHKIHEAYDESDWDLRYPDAVTLWINDVTVDYPKGANTCVNCHQPRVPYPMPELGGADVPISSPYWGPHHGTQSSMLWGTAGYEIAGTVSYPSTPGSSAHASAGCVTCHMIAIPEYGSVAGGHTFNMTYDDHGEETENIPACTQCHDPAHLESFDYKDVMTDNQVLIDSLKNMLVDKGWLNPESGRANVSFVGPPLTLTADQAGVLLNYFMVVEDKSTGIHNPAYTRALLQNSVEFLN